MILEHHMVCRLVDLPCDIFCPAVASRFPSPKFLLSVVDAILVHRRCAAVGPTFSVLQGPARLGTGFVHQYLVRAKGLGDRRRMGINPAVPDRMPSDPDRPNCQGFGSLGTPARATPPPTTSLTIPLSHTAFIPVPSKTWTALPLPAEPGNSIPHSIHASAARPDLFSAQIILSFSDPRSFGVLGHPENLSLICEGRLLASITTIASTYSISFSIHLKTSTILRTVC